MAAVAGRGAVVSCLGRGFEATPRLLGPRRRLSGFDALGLAPSTVEAARQLGFVAPTPVQAAGIPAIAKGARCVALAGETGGGKTLAYLLPVIDRLKREEVTFGPAVRRAGHPRALVLTPTPELARQVGAQAKALGHVVKVATCALSQEQTLKDQSARLAAPVDIAIGTPALLLRHRARGSVSFRDVSAIVLDEAEVLLTRGSGGAGRGPAMVDPAASGADAGLDALEAILRAARAHRECAPAAAALAKSGQGAKSGPGSPGAPPGRGSPAARGSVGDPAARVLAQVVLASATLTPSLERAISARFGTDAHVVRTRALHTLAPSASVRWVEVPAHERHAPVLRLLGAGEARARQPPRTLVFCNTVRSARALQHALAEAGVVAACLHGQMPPARRTAELASFAGDGAEGGVTRVLVATDAASRGLHLPDVRHVLMADFPKDFADFLHRAGRTARAGADGRVTMLVSERERRLAEALRARVQAREPVEPVSAARPGTARSLRLGAEAAIAMAGAAGPKPRQRHLALVGARRTATRSYDRALRSLGAPGLQSLGRSAGGRARGRAGRELGADKRYWYEAGKPRTHFRPSKRLTQSSKPKPKPKPKRR